MIIGMIRYALPVKFNKGNHISIEQLYEDPYFSDRFKIFCDITLESFKQQTNKDFILLVYNSNLIPEDKKELFDNLEKENSFMKNMYLPDNHMYIPEEYIDNRLLSFRIDNDDGVPVDFIERLKEVENTEKNNVVITIPKLRKICRIEENEYKSVCVNYVSNSIGLASLRDDKKTIMDLGNHTTLNKIYKMKSLSGNGGLQVINNYNVSNRYEYKVKGEEDIILGYEEMKSFLVKEGYPEVNLTCLPIKKDKK